MIFYKVTAILSDEKWLEEHRDGRIETEHKRQIAADSEIFDQKNIFDGYLFVASIEHNEITCGAIDLKNTDIMKPLQAFFKAIRVKGKGFKTEEITLSSLSNLLRKADRYSFIDDDEDVLDRFGINIVNNRSRFGISYGENLIRPFPNKTHLYTKSEKMLAKETLTTELDRIYSGKSKSGAFGHPVHYFVETSDRETRKTLYGTLLEALYDNNRLQCRRYCFTDLKPGEEFCHISYDLLYKSCIGGAIVVRYLADDDSEEGEYANSTRETISTLCETMMRYRNQVLTVFCLPRVCEKTRQLFLEYLGTVGMVEIKEDLANKAKSTGYFQLLCKERHIRPDRNLFAKLEADHMYLPEELRDLFEEWYNNKMKTVIFPQYRELVTCREEAVKEAAHGTAFDDLQEMIGLEDAKGVIAKALNYYKLQRLYKDEGIKQDRPAMHMVFTGNPGTAKTTAARLFARIMKENNLLSKGHLVEVGRGDLVARYVGWTAKTVKEKFKDAMGGVLFIDEAYSLVDDRGGSFGDEAINTIVQEMENHREDLVVIFAGYPEEMEAFLNKNPGLRSRIAFHVPFADYSAEELCEIAKLMGKSKGITLTDGAMTKLSSVFETARQQDDFGNGRYVRNILELSRMNQARRLLASETENITKSALLTLEESDIEVPAAKPKTAERKIGFGA